ncbi:MAG TPA: CopG family ribbon-helix-helix protein [Candidatus Thermoplasmatota archaeon]|nr:CopG family ribbon-helix-helix protein [Candidatus Thermoplasmatota archaeon]
MAVVSVSLPDSLVEQADAFIAERGYAGRSELVRAAMRDFLAHEAAPGGAAARSATLTLLYPEGHERKIGEIRHGFTDIVRSMMHGHARGLCVEVFVLEGSGKRIQQFGDALRAAKETRLVQTVYTDAAGAADAGHPHSH